MVSGYCHCGITLDQCPHAQEEASFKDAVIDACVVHWVYVREHDTDPRKAIEDVLRQVIREALDPAISEAAHALVSKIEALEAELASAKAAFQALTDEVYRREAAYRQRLNSARIK